MAAPAKLAIDIVVNSRGAKKEIDDTSDSVSGLGKTTENSSKGMSAALAGFAGGAAFGAVKQGFDMVVDVIGNSIKAASDLNETTSQTSQIFGDAAPAIEAFASNSASALGLSQRAAKDAANNFATFGKAAGLTGGDLTSFSTDLVSLSADLASFKNTTPEEAANALGAALRGESEPMRKYGVLLDDATLKARAMKMGLISATTDALTPQQKALAAQAEIMAQTADAQGDFTKTQGGLANQQRIVAAQWEDMQATLGQALLPILTALGGFLTATLIPALQSAAKFIADNVGWIGPLAAAVGVAVAAVWAWTAAQAAFNTVMALNPVVLIVIAIVAAIAALAVAFVWLWNNCETFRTVVTAVFEAAWSVIKTVISAIGAVFTWLWDSVISPVIGFIGAMFTWLWTSVVSPIIGFLIEGIKGWAAIISWLWDSVISPVIGFIGTIFSWLWSSVISPIIGFLIEGIKGWAAIISWLWDSVISPVIGFIGTIFSWLWSSVISPVIGFLIEGIKGWAAILSWLWSSVVSPVIGFIVEYFKLWWSVVSWVIEAIMGVFRSLAGFLSEIIGRIAAIGAGMWNWVADGVAKVWDWITGTWNKVIDFIGGIAGRLTDSARGMWDGIWEAFKTVINLIIRGWNALEFRIPGFDLGPVHFDGFTLGVPDIPFLAAGGVVRRPTLAVIGEAGPEIVSPTPLLRRLIAEGAAAGAGGVVENNFYMTFTHTGLAADSPALQRDVVDAIRRYETRNGPARQAG
jgi:hypothetical protein